MVVEELADSVEEHQEVGVGEGVPTCVSCPLHCLVQPDTHICGRRAWEYLLATVC